MRKIFLLSFLLLILFIFASCNESKSDVVFTVNNPICSEHTFGEWNTLINPTSISDGLKQRICTNCGFGETEKIPKNTFSYSINENGNKFFEVQVPFNPHEPSSDNTAENSYDPIKIVIDEIGKTIIIEGDTFPPNTSIDDIKSNIEQILKDNNINITPDFDYDIKIPGYEDSEDFVPTPYYSSKGYPSW